MQGLRAVRILNLPKIMWGERWPGLICTFAEAFKKLISRNDITSLAKVCNVTFLIKLEVGLSGTPAQKFEVAVFQQLRLIYLHTELVVVCFSLYSLFIVKQRLKC